MSVVETAPTARRPAVVSLAGYLMFVVAGIAAVRAVLLLPYVSDVSNATKRVFAGGDPDISDQVATIVAATLYVYTAVYLIVAVAFAVLGRFDLRGSHAARIVTWVVGGLGALCCCIGQVFNGTNVSVQQQQLPSGMSRDEAERIISAALPAWVNPVTVATTVLAMVALILVIILLALPAAHPYFRRGRELPTDAPLPYPPVE